MLEVCAPSSAMKTDPPDWRPDSITHDYVFCPLVEDRRDLIRIRCN